jgi:hypothetical protein
MAMHGGLSSALLASGRALADFVLPTWNKHSMRVMRAHKTVLDLHNAQVTACKRHAGAARYAYT